MQSAFFRVPKLDGSILSSVHVSNSVGLTPQFPFLYERRTKLYVKLNAIQKLGPSPIGCEDFSIPASIKNGVLV